MESHSPLPSGQLRRRGRRPGSIGALAGSPAVTAALPWLALVLASGCVGSGWGLEIGAVNYPDAAFSGSFTVSFDSVTGTDVHESGRVVLQPAGDETVVYKRAFVSGSGNLTVNLVGDDGRSGGRTFPKWTPGSSGNQIYMTVSSSGDIRVNILSGS